MNNVYGKSTLIISGGVFEGMVYGVCRVGENDTGISAEMSGSVVLEISGGTFKKGITAVQDGTIAVTGSNMIYLSTEMDHLRSKITGYSEINRLG